ncbi:cache domain-containing protein [Motiliproteus sp. MSK22-1]
MLKVGDNYFFIFDEKLRMVMHPIKPSFEGKDFSYV